MGWFTRFTRKKSPITSELPPKDIVDPPKDIVDSPDDIVDSPDDIVDISIAGFYHSKDDRIPIDKDGHEIFPSDIYGVKPVITGIYLNGLPEHGQGSIQILKVQSITYSQRIWKINKEINDKNIMTRTLNFLPGKYEFEYYPDYTNGYHNPPTIYKLTNMYDKIKKKQIIHVSSMLSNLSGGRRKRLTKRRKALRHRRRRRTIRA